MTLLRSLQITLAAAIFLASASPAEADLEVSHAGFTELGTPVARAQDNPGEESTITWEICRPSEPCVPAGGGAQLSPGAQPPGTVFSATATRTDGSTLSGRTLPWPGQVTAVSPARLTGRVAVGGTVRVQRATWNGGFGLAYSTIQILSCEAPGVGCAYRATAETLTTFDQVTPSVLLTPDDFGRYMMVVEQRYPANALFPQRTVANVTPLPTRSITTARRVAGPTARLRDQGAARSRGRIGLGNVTCGAGRCKLRVAVKSGRKTVRMTRSFRGTTSLVLRVPPPRPPVVTVTIVVNDHEILSGRVALSDDVRIRG